MSRSQLSVIRTESRGAGTPILVIGAQHKGFVVRTGLADREIVQVKIGDEAKIRLDALPGQTLHGRVTEVSGAADTGSGMFGIEVSLDPMDLPLKSGLVAKLTVVPSSASAGSRVYVPIGAIVEAQVTAEGDGDVELLTPIEFEFGKAVLKAIPRT